jgi:putative flavoprotein involved in K+ transport
VDAEPFDVVVLGAGQAGLAAGYHLARLGLQFVILDDGQQVGDSWRNRRESLRLFTPARLDSLPGLPFPAATYAPPTKDGMADYLCSYASRFNLPVRLRTRVDKVTADDGRFVISAGEHRFVASNVIGATGGQPKLPNFARDLDPEICQLHSGQYRSPAQLKPGEVLVVGAGNSGAEISIDAAGAGHRTWLAGRKTGTAPTVIYSRPTWWLATHLITVSTPVGRRIAPRALARGAPLVRLRESNLAAAGVRRAPRVENVEHGQPVFGDGRPRSVENVVWCTGYGWNLDWLQINGVGPEAPVRFHRGIFEHPTGLYSVGRPFQFGIDSALIAGVGRDAGYVVSHIAQRRSAKGASSSPR